MDVISYILSRAYVNKTLVGMGALKGAPAMISSIVDKPDGTHDITFSWKDNSDVTHTSILTVANGETPTITSTEIEGGHTITFATTDPSQSVSFNVMDGEEGQRGVSVIRADVDANNYLKLELSDGNIINAGQIKTVSMVDNTLSLESENPVQNKVITKKFDEYKTAFTGTEEEWDALTSEEQNVYDIINITNDGDVLNLGVYLEKKTAMPVASEDVENKIYLYTGTTTQNYKKGVVYQCVSDGQDPATYSWVALIDFGTASIKNSTDRVSPNNTDLVESQSVYSAINTALSSIYTPRGDITCAELTSALLISDNIGNVYETSDSGTTTALFLQGAGHPIATGSNVGIINAGQGRILFNLMANAFDLTNYQKIDLTQAVEGATTVEGALGALSTDKQPKNLTTAVESATTVENALGALSTNKADKVSSATNGNFAGLDANGNLTDSGKKASDFATATETAEEVNSLKETLTNFEESITGEVVDSEPYVLRQGLGNLADMALVGGSVAWNQLVQNGNFASTSGWSANGAGTVISASNNELSITASVQSGGIYQRISQAISGHKYLQSIDVKNTKALKVGYGNSAISITDSHTSFTNVSSVFNSQNTNGVFIVYSEAGSSENTIVLKNVNLIDLTQMFGSTIADYIYALEQATAGAGVAWFRKYFPNAYYGYQSGKIESVNPSKRVVEPTSKNIFDVNAYPFTNNYFIHGLNGIPAASGTGFKCTLGYVPCFFLQGKTLTLNKRPQGNDPGIYFYDANKENISGIRNNDATEYTPWTFTVPNNAVYMRFTVPINATDIQIEVGSESTAYVPYKKLEYPFDPSIQLRGVPKLVDNKLSYDGDIYKADGSITRKYGIVDLGDYTWQYAGEDNRFYVSIALSDVNAPYAPLNNPNYIAKAICSKYAIVSRNDLDSPSVNYGLSMHNSNTIYLSIKDVLYTDAAAFKTAMSGVYLVYELATPTTESANAFQNPQRAFTDGTEEFVDYGVQSATRDVSIPVGNNTTYQLNETLPPTEDYVDGALKFKAAISALGTDESGRTTASRAYTTGEFFYKDGKMYKVLTSIAQGATFTVGTNCQQTTLFAELKALAQ